jgi:hypothetical protein
MLSPFIALDPISIACECNRKTLISELLKGSYHKSFKKGFVNESEISEILSHPLFKREFSYWAEKLVTTWYKSQRKNAEMAICDVPIGPIMEYELMKEIILETPPSVYLSLGTES